MNAIFLSGPMGSGKSTIGRLLARKLGTSFVDLDHEVTNREGMPVREIFRQRGEAAFRTIERETALMVSERGGVVALGGGTVVDRRTRHALLTRGTLITLRAPLEELIRRTQHSGDRPLLQGRDPAEVFVEILESRAAAYAECHAEVWTGSRGYEEICDEITRVAEDRPVAVALGERSYRVEIGRGIAGRVGERFRETGTRGTIVTVSDTNVAEPWLANAGRTLEASGFRTERVILTPGEENKNLRSIDAIWSAALAASIDRSGGVLGVGGGVVGDLAAFAASTILRGVRLGQVPSSLLAMVDSSVGGKTGFDRPEGKNLIGSFYQPRFVLCDVDVLSTLPIEERVAGLAEVAKAAWIDGEGAVSALERDADALRAGDPDATLRAIRMAVGLKAKIVSEDERESGPRALLNLGHTYGHAIEASSNWQVRHGEAVALGMVVAIRLSHLRGLARQADVERMVRLLSRLGLPIDFERWLDERARGFIKSDKKRTGGSVRFVFPREAGRVEIEAIDLSEVDRLASNLVAAA